MGVLAQRKHIALGTRVAPDVPDELIGDFNRLQQILMNLVGNAIKFTDHGKIDVHIFLDQNPGTWSMQVSDTGRGLDETAKTRIFEPFWTTKNEEVSGGPAAVSGLGLAIAHGLVHMLGGTITVTSELGKGSCFRVTFPRTDLT